MVSVEKEGISGATIVPTLLDTCESVQLNKVEGCEREHDHEVDKSFACAPSLQLAELLLYQYLEVLLLRPLFPQLIRLSLDSILDLFILVHKSESFVSGLLFPIDESLLIHVAF